MTVVVRGAYEVVNILRAGTNVEVSAEDYAAYDLVNMAMTAKISGAQIIINDSEKLASYDATKIAMAGRNNVTLR